METDTEMQEPAVDLEPQWITVHRNVPGYHVDAGCWCRPIVIDVALWNAMSDAQKEEYMATFPNGG